MAVSIRVAWSCNLFEEQHELNESGCMYLELIFTHPRCFSIMVALSSMAVGLAVF